MERKITAEEVENFLERNKDFTESFFIRNATPSMIDRWYEERNILGVERRLHSCIIDRKGTSYNFAKSPVNTLSEEERTDENEEEANEDSLIYTPRRYSEPPSPVQEHDKKLTSSCAPRSLSEKRKPNKRNLLKQTDIKTMSLDRNRFLKEKIPDGSTKHDIPRYILPTFGASDEFNYIKPALRKAKSLPIRKSTLAKLINSTVYLRASPTLDWHNKQDLKSASERDFFNEVVRDITKDLNLRTLCYRVLVNVGIITNARKGSVFLLDEDNGEKILICCFDNIDVHFVSKKDTDRRYSETLKTFGKGIVSHVAKTGETICVENITEAPLYDASVDGQHEPNLTALCKPIKSSNGEVIGVVLLTKDISDEFTEESKQVLERYLTFCGICITNARLFDVSKQEFNRNKALLELAHEIFEEQTSLNKVVNKIMHRALDLLKCKQCSILLISDPKHRNLFSDDSSRFSHVFQLTGASNANLQYSRNEQDIQQEIDFKLQKRNSRRGPNLLIAQRSSMDLLTEGDPLRDHIAEFVVLSGKAYNSNRRKNNTVVNGNASESNDGHVLCMPIRNNLSQAIGIIKLCRKPEDEMFSENDEKLLEAFGIFCGLGINNCILYDKICRGKAHQKVALEVLSYHTTARQLEVERLKLSAVPSKKALNLTDLRFDDFSLLDDQMLTASIRMFMEFGFIQEYQIEYDTLCRWILTVRKNYRRVIYHNWRHAFNVAQSVFAALTTGKLSEYLSSTECLALLVGCLCHDLDHRGTNNEFQAKSESPVARLYGTSTMEHHHFNHAVMILNSEGNNIFQHLTSEEYSNVMKYLKHAILATDLAQYVKYRSTFFPMVENKTWDSNKMEHRALLRSMLMTACDLNGITKPWKVQKKVVHLVTSEFFHQGDIERDKLHVEPKAIMDRNNILQLPKLQVGFFDAMGIPVYKALSSISPALQPLYDGAVSNRNRWEQLSQQVEQGSVDPELEPVLNPVKTDDDLMYT